jgi:hypothetical protein
MLSDLGLPNPGGRVIPKSKSKIQKIKSIINIDIMRRGKESLQQNQLAIRKSGYRVASRNTVT